MIPDRILIGDVVTMDGAGMRAEAVAVTGGRIAAAGRRSEVMALRGPKTEVHDFGRAAVIPGFNDVHAHMDTEGMKLARPALHDARSIADVLARVAALAADRPKGAWVVTMPIGTLPHYFGGPASLAEGRMPDRHELDRVAPDHPVCILPPSGYWGQPPCHMALNSLALKLNGIDRDTVPRLPGVEIVKDAAGEPTGVFIDMNPRESAQLDLMPAVPRFSLAERRAGIRAAMRLYHAEGTTSAYEGHGCSPEVIGIYRDLWQAGDLTMRLGMVVAPPWAGAAEAEGVMRDWLPYARGRGLGDARFRIGGIHVNLGGDPVAAAMARALANDTGYWSHLWQANAMEEFAALATLAAKYDLRFHTIASAGTQRQVLPVLQRIDATYPLNGRRWVIEHLSLSRPEDLAAIKAMGIGVTLIPMHHLWKNGAAFLTEDAAAQELIVPAGPLQAMGVPVAAGTDNTPCDPLVTMQTLMLREERTTGTVIGPGARLSAAAALATVTSAGAWFTFEEDVKGRLVPGHFADIAVLSDNPLDTDPRNLTGIECIATMVGGDFVHGP
ncbi:MAG: amidohydrolase [Rhodospirillaceae bacterium]